MAVRVTEWRKAAAGGEPSGAAAVWKDGTRDRRAAALDPPRRGDQPVAQRHLPAPHVSAGGTPELNRPSPVRDGTRWSYRHRPQAPPETGASLLLPIRKEWQARESGRQSRIRGGIESFLRRKEIACSPEGEDRPNGGAPPKSLPCRPERSEESAFLRVPDPSLCLIVANEARDLHFSGRPTQVSALSSRTKRGICISPGCPTQAGFGLEWGSSQELAGPARAKRPLRLASAAVHRCIARFVWVAQRFTAAIQSTPTNGFSR